MENRSRVRDRHAVTPFALGTLWVFIPALLTIVALVVRIAL